MLALDRVGKTYPNGVRALDGISLEVAPGEILVVIGGSGCGKSTMLRAISGLDTPSQGKVVLDGTVITEPHEEIGIIFQEPRLLPWLRVADNVGFGLEHYPGQERTTRVARALDRVGLSEKARVWPRELSGGQAQRVAIARTRQVDLDFVGDPAGVRPHHDDAVGKCNRLFHIVGDHDQRRLEFGPQVEQVVLQVDAGEGVER